jgi:hypothetical protein
VLNILAAHAGDQNLPGDGKTLALLRQAAHNAFGRGQRRLASQQRGRDLVTQAIGLLDL